jgi:hypothetical protein
MLAVEAVGKRYTSDGSCLGKIEQAVIDKAEDSSALASNSRVKE